MGDDIYIEWRISRERRWGVQVWRVEDAKQIATMKARNVLCLAVSNDDRWIAAGTSSGDVIVWDTKTYEQVSHSRAISGPSMQSISRPIRLDS